MIAMSGTMPVGVAAGDTDGGTGLGLVGASPDGADSVGGPHVPQHPHAPHTSLYWLLLAAVLVCLLVTAVTAKCWSCRCGAGRDAAEVECAGDEHATYYAQYVKLREELARRARRQLVARLSSAGGPRGDGLTTPLVSTV